MLKAVVCISVGHMHTCFVAEHVLGTRVSNKCLPNKYMIEIHRWIKSITKSYDMLYTSSIQHEISLQWEYFHIHDTIKELNQNLIYNEADLKFTHLRWKIIGKLGDV